MGFIAQLEESDPKPLYSAIRQFVYLKSRSQNVLL